MMAAERVAPTGGVIISDQAEAMLEGARARAAELGLRNVEFRVLGAEWIDLPGRERRRRALPLGLHAAGRPGGRARRDQARAARGWTRGAGGVGRDRAQPLGAAAGGRAARAGSHRTAHTGAPGPFVLGDSERVRALLEQAGFTEIDVQGIAIEQRYDRSRPSGETTLDISRGFHDAVLSRPESEIAEIHAGLRSRLAPYTSAEGRLTIPARTLVASATA